MTPTWKLAHYYRTQINFELERMMRHMDTGKKGDRRQILAHHRKLLNKVTPRGRHNTILKIEGVI